ncbi:hypothetical protein CRYUN_Cryun22dG0017400 [Craigia yunnanensis]
MTRARKRSILLSKLCSFACCRPTSTVEHAQIGQKGYSRVVYCNEPDSQDQIRLKYRGNSVSTTKYTAANFIPKSLFEQFRRVANIYFLVVACVSFSPLAPYSAPSILVPLIVVIGGATMAKEDGVCYVETMNLDGETNLKLKHALEILLRDSKLKNTDYIYGVVIFTGHDTKVTQNATDPPSKRTKIERRMAKIVYVLFSTLILVSSIGSLFFGIEIKKDISGGNYRKWYLRLDKTTVFYNPRRASVAAFLHFLTGLVLYGYLIPVSLYVSIEIVKVLQSIFINQDQAMYDEETDRPAHARTSNLNEELGQVHTILCDKTRTLTCNSMEFVKCSIAGTAYGCDMADVEIAMARKKDERLIEPTSIDPVDSGKSVKSFHFRDERIMNGKWVKEPHSDVIQKFFRVLATCHTAVPKVTESGEIIYEAESPDEAAFVIAVREVGLGPLLVCTWVGMK